MDPYIGKLLDNRYEILEAIGNGGMARVYKARCHRLNRLVAIKILREDLAQDAEFRRRFHDESQAVAMLSHPNIVAVYDVSRGSDMEYLVMELIDGINLKQYMQRKGNKLNWREALHFTTQVVKALGHAHSRGIIHRDIKPHNIMVLRDGSVKVADFGIARLMSGNHSTLTQEAIGSVHYISPEQARGSHIDARSDLYSAGVVLYEMLTGRLPFEGDSPVSVAIQHINSIPLSPRELDPSIPEALESITMRAMAPDMSRRYASADEMLIDLEEFRKNPDISFDYDTGADFTAQTDTEEDPDRTRIIPGGHTERRRSRQAPAKERKEERYYEEEAEGKHSSTLPVMVGVAIVLLFILGVFFFLFQNLSGIFTPAQKDKVPNLVGMTYEEVLGNKQLLGRFELEIGNSVEDSAPEGTILEQSPTENSEVTSAVGKITVVVSAGPDIVYMVNLFDKEYRDAFAALDKIGLTHGNVTYEHHDEIEKDHVISFTPLTDMPVAPGTKVDMVISLGPEVKMVPLPSFAGMAQAEAEDNIHFLKLEVGAITPVFSDVVPEGKVVEQYPAATTEVPEGSTVNLQISKGPDPEAGPQTKTKQVSVPLPDAVGIVDLQVTMDGFLVYQGQWDAAMNNAVPIVVNGRGQKELCVYYNGVLNKTIPVDFEA